MPTPANARDAGSVLVDMYAGWWFGDLAWTKAVDTGVAMVSGTCADIRPTAADASIQGEPPEADAPARL